MWRQAVIEILVLSYKPIFSLLNEFALAPAGILSLKSNIRPGRFGGMKGFIVFSQ